MTAALARDIERIAEIKAGSEALHVYAIQRQIGKDAERDPPCPAAGVTYR